MLKILYVFLVFSQLVSASSYYISNSGDDSNVGDYDNPFKTFSKAIEQPDVSEINFEAGTYHIEHTFTKHKTALTIQACAGEEVIIDGTIALDGGWSKHSGKIFKKVTTNKVWQLFENRKMLNAARWPNVKGFIEDKEPIQPFLRDSSMWDVLHSWGASDPSSSEGVMINYVDSIHTNSLAALPFSVKGAIGILNVGSFKTYAAEVTSHSIGSNTFEYDMSRVGRWEKSKHAAYYLEGKLEFIDVPGEWYYDTLTSTVYVYTKNGTKPVDGEIRGKNSTYAFDIDDCDDITIKGFKFFGTTVKVFKSRGIKLLDNVFSYPSYSKRMIRKFPEYIEVTLFDNVKNCEIRNNIFEYTEGEGLHLGGDYNKIDNNLFRHIDFACADLRNLGGSVNFFGNRNEFTYNTLYLAGTSETLTPGDSSLVEGNDLASIGHLQNDGSTIQYMVSKVPGSITKDNWIHDIQKSAMRYDGSLQSPGLNPGDDQTCGIITGNVVWNLPEKTGFVIKGDYHLIVNNTVFHTGVGIGVVDQSGGGQRPEEGWSNGSTVTKNNLSSIVGERYRFTRTLDNFPIPGVHSNNHNPYEDGVDSVVYMLQDWKNRDFRVINDPRVVDAGDSVLVNGALKVERSYKGDTYDIGALEYGVLNYKVAGRREVKATNPIPAVGSKSSSKEVMFAWKPAYKADKYNVYIYNKRTASSFPIDPTYTIENNFITGVEVLKGDTVLWRVDVVNGPDTITGEEWSFVGGVDSPGEVVTAVEKTVIIDSKIFYPNPSRGIFNVRDKSLKVFDVRTISGKLVPFTFERGSVKLSQPTGIYFLQTSNGTVAIYNIGK